MEARTILNVDSPKTQTLEAVKTLLAWKGRAADPLPSFIEMGKEEIRLVLVLSNKHDAYYCVTSRACSCPAAAYHPGQPCKHQRKYFPVAKVASRPSEPESIRPAAEWIGPDGQKANGPLEA